MSRWELALRLDETDGQPKFLRLARAITSEIERGRLTPGSPLPGSRALAETLSIHRNTVLAAYDELQAQGWIETLPARGTFVSSTLPQSTLAVARAPSALPEPIARARPERSERILTMYGGLPDFRLMPITALTRAYRRVLGSALGRAALAYGDPRGHERLRAALATMLRQARGLAISEEQVLITRGSQMAIDLAAQTLFAPGDLIAVEAPGYRPAWEAFRLRGLRLVPVRVDEGGIDVRQLDQLVRRRRVRGLYVTPHHQYPTTTTLAAGRRLELLALARRHRVTILEDDYDHEFHYEGRPVLPLASAAAEVVYIGTLSKLLAPGLRVGYLVSSTSVVERLAARRASIDTQGDHAVECALAELFEDGEVQRHARRARRLYRARRDQLARALLERLPHVLELKIPTGGMALWARVAPSVDVERWAAASRGEGVLFHPGSRFSFDGRPLASARFGFAALDEQELDGAVARLVRALKAVS